MLFVFMINASLAQELKGKYQDVF